jgi:hypothetical protein
MESRAEIYKGAGGGVVGEGVSCDGVAMGDLRGLAEAGRAGEEECRCCVF